MRVQKSVATLSIAAVCALTTSVTFAQDFFAYLADGPYLGLQAGYDSYSHQRQVNDFNPETGLITPIDNDSLSANGWLGGLIAGYGYYFKEFYYLGVEAIGNLNMRTLVKATHYNANLSDEYNQSEVITRGSFGISLLPGIKINESTLGYLRIGYNWANIQYKYAAQNNDLRYVDSFKGNIVGGLNIGVGVEAGFVDNVSVRADVSHTFYQGFYSSMRFYDSLYYQSNINPSGNQATLALIYHFI